MTNRTGNTSITTGAFGAGRVRMLLLICLALLLLACGSSEQAGNEAKSDTQIDLAASPEGMDGEFLTVTLLDASGQPITDATVSLEGNMNHAGMVPVLSDEVMDDADGSADGQYRVPFQFTMMGDWIISVRVQWADGTTTTRDIDVTANDAGVNISDAGAVIITADLAVMHATARPVPIAGGNGAIYLTIVNYTDGPERLVSVSSPLAPAELHETIDDNGVTRMRMHPDGFAIPMGEPLYLQPGGKHIMLVGIEHPVELGQSLTLTLEFATHSPITLTIPVHPFGASNAEMAGAMEHADHQ